MLEGWFNTDIDPEPGTFFLDATASFPVDDRSFDYVFVEHMIEHLTWEQGRFMLRECHRVLKPGGRIRIATPDLAWVISLREAASEEAARYNRWYVEAFVPEADRCHPAFVINKAFRGWGHRFLYDEETLGASLEAAGFVRPVRPAYSGSDDPELAGIDRPPDESAQVMRALESLIVEARRA